MLITVTRTYKDDDGLYGLLSIDMDVFKCATLERLSKCIPVGTYDLLFMWSDHFQQIMPHIIVPAIPEANLPKRIAIEVHWANYSAQLDGCLALGTDGDKKDDMITDSKKAFAGFAQAITDRYAMKIKFVEDFGHV